MKIKSAKSFRFWYKTKVKEIEKYSPSHNENFVGTYHTENGKKIKGFFEMYHGDKPDIASYLPSILKIAEDGQAIYEFLQNAVDCNSTHFYIFYNEKYFLAINNGEPFDIEGLQSVLNIAQTTKKSCDKIGRFGIGFKLVHRLVGKNEGVSELVNQYKGPILFSWAKLQDLQGLMNKEPLEPIFSENENEPEYKIAPHLLKLILTNFPAEPNEVVRDLNYNEKVVFTQEELNELIEFLNASFKQHSESIDFNDLKQGSIFFLRLGEGKKEMLDRDYEDLKKGVQYSMNTLKHLQKVYINSEDIGKQTLELEEFEIAKNSKEFALINPEYKECNIKVSFGYYRNYKQSEKIKASPNFYKYFPMGDETNGFSFIIHCDSFSNEANRRKLQKDSINKNLLPVISNFIITRLNEYKKNNREKFLRLYACLLLSDVPDKQNNEWLKPIFYDDLLDYLCTNIPTKNNQFSEESENVKINKLKLNLNLSDFGLDHIQWFEWESDNDSDLTLQATNSEKLGLENWDIRDIIENADLDCINEWIESQNTEQYNLFLNEIEKSSLRKETKNRLCEIKLFKFSDDCFYSVNDLQNIDDLIFNFTKTIKIKSELEKLGFTTSELDISKYENIFSALSAKLPTDKNLYENIAEKCEDNSLTPKEKQRLFLNFVQDETKFDNIAKETLKNLALFCNNAEEIKPLCELVDSALPTPTWINSFKIKAEENFAGLKKYLISEQELYQEIILPNWEDIISEVPNITEFYSKVKFYYNQKENMPLLGDKPFVFVNEEGGFIPASDVFYNSKFTQTNTYKDFQNAAYNLINAQTPKKEVLKYLKEAPFKIENVNLFDYSINDGVELDLQELKSIIEFCKSNNENFFENCVVEKQGQSVIVSEKSSNIYQIRPPKKEVKQFIEENLNDTFKILPYELDEYKDEVGIIQGEKLYDVIVSEVDVDDFKEELVNILAYDEPKRKFLLQLSEIRLVSGEEYNSETFEFKMLNLACSVLNSKEDVVTFKDKVVIETNEQDLTLSEIPPFADKVKIENCELSLAKILPNTYQNSDHLSNLIQHFGNIGIDKNRLNALFGINQEPEISDIFKVFSEETTTVENAEQLAFTILYNKYIEEIDLKALKVTCKGGGEYDLTHDFYTKQFDFLIDDATLDDKYKGIKKVLVDLPFYIADDNQLLEEPYFDEGVFVCPDLDTEMSDEQKLSFIEFLFNQWDKKNKKTAIRNIDWSNINEIKTEKLLGFDPNYSVYPSEYALESEALPNYLLEWLGEDNIKINFIADLGVFTECSTLLALRRYFNNEGTFNKSKIAQDSRLADEKMLFNTFEWLKSKELELDSKEEFEVLEEMARVINTKRLKNEELIIWTDYDFTLLESEAKEWDASYYKKWKIESNNKYTIFLFDRDLPQYASVYCNKLYQKYLKDKKINWTFSDFIFYRFNQSNIAINNENKIYINRNADIKKALSSLISGENDFTTEDLLLLYQTKETVQSENDEVAELKSEVERLRQVIESLTRVSGRDNNDVTIKTDDYFTEIKEKSEEYLFNLLRREYPSQIVKWLNYNEQTEQFEESWKNHDFEILNKNGTALHYIDCKGTPQQKRTFYLTSNEWDFFLDCVQNGKSYQIYRIFNVEGSPSFVHIDNLWEWIQTGKVVPYLSATETIKGGRVFLTLM